MLEGSTFPPRILRRRDREDSPSFRTGFEPRESNSMHISYKKETQQESFLIRSDTWIQHLDHRKRLKFWWFRGDVDDFSSRHILRRSRRARAHWFSTPQSKDPHHQVVLWSNLRLSSSLHSTISLALSITVFFSSEGADSDFVVVAFLSFSPMKPLTLLLSDVQIRFNVVLSWFWISELFLDFYFEIVEDICSKNIRNFPNPIEYSNLFWTCVSAAWLVICNLWIFCFGHVVVLSLFFLLFFSTPTLIIQTQERKGSVKKSMSTRSIIPHTLSPTEKVENICHFLPTFSKRKWFSIQYILNPLRIFAYFTKMSISNFWIFCQFKKI